MMNDRCSLLPLAFSFIAFSFPVFFLPFTFYFLLFLHYLCFSMGLNVLNN